MVHALSDLKSEDVVGLFLQMGPWKPLKSVRPPCEIKSLVSVGKNHNQTCNISNQSTFIGFDQFSDGNFQ